MSVPDVLSKGCVPELSLVGSRVPEFSLVSSHVDRSVAILPHISRMPASPHRDAGLSHYNTTRSLLGSPHSLVMTHRESSLVGASRLAYETQRWLNPAIPHAPGNSHAAPTDADVLSQAMRLQRFTVSNKIQLNGAPPVGSLDNRTPLNNHDKIPVACNRNKTPLDNHCNRTTLDHHGNMTTIIHSRKSTPVEHHDNITPVCNHDNKNISGNTTPMDRHGNRTPVSERSVTDQVVTDSTSQNLHRTWHSELLREDSKESSNSYCNNSDSSHHQQLSSHHGGDGENETHLLSTESTALSTETLGKDKPRKEKKRKKKKSSKLNLNKTGRTKIKFKSAGRSRSLPATKQMISHDNKETLMIAQCTAIKVLPSPPKAPKPKVTISPFLLSHALVGQKQNKLMMGGVASTSTSTTRTPYKLTDTRTAIECLVTVNNRIQDVTSTRAPPSRTIKVFCSDRQSGVLKELGMERPCAPPVTPVPEMLMKYEYIPSLNDVRSQRAIKIRLEAIERVEKLKNEKLKEEKQKYEKIAQKEKEKQLRKRQRLEIYALNKVMTELENANFMEFCRKNGINT